MKKIAVYFLIVSLIPFTQSCKKDSSNNNNNTGTAKVAVHMIDAPGDFDAVYIDVQSIEMGTEAGGWIALPLYRPGIYNLLDFRNGIDTLMCNAEIPAGRVTQMRMILGTNNSVTVKGVNYPLSTPSAQQSGLKFNLQTDLVVNGSYAFWIDFDAGKSIVEQGNGDYSLKPVIRTYTQQTDGRIKGTIFPFASVAIVYAIQGGQTYSAIPAPDGRFVFCGLPEGAYTVRFEAKDGSSFSDLELNNIQVKFGVITDLGLHNLLP
ncbi:MAG: DUF4382 domain-containing protein [Chitinophagaceae bacterium]|jgi:hypothetical protein